MSDIDTIRTVLGAYDRATIRRAIHAFALGEKAERDAQGWALFTGETPPRGWDWMRIGGKIYIRPAIPSFRASGTVTVQATRLGKARRATTGTGRLSCPHCGVEAYPQPVCPNCAKGKAGLKTMWICGENADHIFYTE